MNNQLTDLEEEIIRTTVQAVIQKHYSFGVSSFISHAEDIFRDIPENIRPSKDLYTKILSCIESYVNENFSCDANRRCMPGDLDIGERPKEILKYVMTHLYK
jgi:hypothetical protein